MNTPITEYEGNQLEIDFNLDRPEFSICPNCSSQIIKLVDGCDVCGWALRHQSDRKQRWTYNQNYLTRFEESQTVYIS